MSKLAHAPEVRSAAMALVVGLLLTPTAAAVRSSTAGAALAGDPAGLRLVQQVNGSYKSVPAVRVEVTAQGGFTGRFTLALRNGVAVAEHAVVRVGDAKPTQLVRRGNTGTFVRDAGRSCWRFVPSSDPQALTDVGRQVLSAKGRVSKPRVVGDSVTMTLTDQGRQLRVVVDRRSSRLREMNAPGYVARFMSLAKSPELPVAKPRC